MFICTLHRCLHHGVSMNFASDRASFCNIQTRYKLKTLPKRFLVRSLSWFFCSLLHAIVQKFPNIFVHDNYTVSRHYLYSIRLCFHRLYVSRERLVRISNVLIQEFLDYWKLSEEVKILNFSLIWMKIEWKIRESLSCFPGHRKLSA